jgi:hypothetical protein
LSTSYNASVTPELIEMLNSKSEEARWDRVAAMLGAVGDERAARALIQFIEKPVNTQRLSFESEAARQSAIMSLGFLVNRTGSEQALSYLIDGLTPTIWRQRKVTGIASWSSSNEEYDLELSKYALFGLSLSGHPRAGEALRSLQLSPTPEQARFRSDLDETLPQWLEVHALVAERGIAGMYEHYAAQEQLEREQEPEEFP